MPSLNAVLTVLMITAVSVPTIHAAPFSSHVGSHRLSSNERRGLAAADQIYAREDHQHLISPDQQQRRAPPSNNGESNTASTTPVGQLPTVPGAGPSATKTSSSAPSPPTGGIMAGPGPLSFQLSKMGQSTGPTKPMTEEQVARIKEEARQMVGDLNGNLRGPSSFWGASGPGVRKNSPGGALGDPSGKPVVSGAGVKDPSASKVGPNEDPTTAVADGLADLKIKP